MSARIMAEIIKVLEAPHTQANYPQVMVRAILKAGGMASKGDIVHALFRANQDLKMPESYFKSVPVFKRNKSIQSIVNIEKIDGVEYYSIKYYGELSHGEIGQLSRLCQKMANSWELVQ